MNIRYLALCGMIAPLLLASTIILGGILRPGYSHLADTISELFSPGSPNKPLLDVLHTIFAILLVMFGIGILRFVGGSRVSMRIGVIGAWLYIAMGLVSITTATIFPQDPWGSAPTTSGQLHIQLIGLVGLLSLISILLLGAWLYQSRLSPGLGIYSFITIALTIILTAVFVMNLGGPIMGLTERVLSLVGLLWTFILARWVYFRI